MKLVFNSQNHSGHQINFYHTMHYSAKRGLAIACRLSVCSSVWPSVTLVDHDHIYRKSWKLIVRAISPTSLLIVAQRSSTDSQGNLLLLLPLLLQSSAVEQVLDIPLMYLPGERGEILGRLQGAAK